MSHHTLYPLVQGLQGFHCPLWVLKDPEGLHAPDSLGYQAYHVLLWLQCLEILPPQLVLSLQGSLTQKSDIIMRTISTSFCSYSGLYSPLCPVKPDGPGLPGRPACPLSHSSGPPPGKPGAPGVPSIPVSPFLPGSPGTPDAPAEKVNQYWWTFWDIFRSNNLYLITIKYYFLYILLLFARYYSTLNVSM